MDLKSPKYYINRELSWLSFNERVLEQARKKETPIFEKLKFLAITASNLDEFFMIRVASLKEQVNAGYKGKDIAGMTAGEQLLAISEEVHQMVKRQSDLFTFGLKRQLRQLGIHLERLSKRNKKNYGEIKNYFMQFIFPNLTPMAFDSGRPFPLILNKSLNVAVILEGHRFATVQVPMNMPRFHLVDSAKGEHRFVMLEDVVKTFVGELFQGQKVVAAALYRITRNADVSIAEDEADDLLKEIEKSLKERRWGQTVRLEIEKNAGAEIKSLLQEMLEVGAEDTYEIEGLLDYTFLFKWYREMDFESFKYAPYEPYKVDMGPCIFDAIKEKDWYFYHPYDSFETVLRFLEEAAADENVLAIKQTLYRVSGDSPVVKALEKAAEAGKQVTVIVELKARFDEENNIRWAKRLEKSGCHVVYGLVGYKIHSKITLVVRREEGGIRRYIHLGTGNYNDITAKIYTDIGILTADKAFGRDASKFFNVLTGYSDAPAFERLEMAPFNLRETFEFLIQREKRHALMKRPARIVAKMNSLVDQSLIQRLYEASRSGVQIDLIIRGICCLRPGLKGISDNIRVISIVGEFLEHNRTFYFENDGQPEIYASSADWMPRNLYRRIELLFPILDEEIKKEILKELNLQLRDDFGGQLLLPDGNYKKIRKKEPKRIDTQTFLKMARIKRRAQELTQIHLVPMQLEAEEEVHGEDRNH